MEKSVQIESILSQISQLDVAARKYLLEEILRREENIRRKGKDSSVSLMDLHRLGSEVWRDVKIDQYIDREREWD